MISLMRSRALKTDLQGCRNLQRTDPVIEQVGRGDRGLGGVQVDLRDLAISIYMGLLINAPNTLESADIEGVLRSQVT